MKSSGSILRGHLRPMGARSPPFLLIGLLVILGILGFNYWNLSYEYDAIIKEIAELQDHLRIAVLKKENADKQSEALEKRFREAEEQLGKGKINSDLRQKELKELQNKFEEKNNEYLSMKSLHENCQLSNSKLNSTQEIADTLQKKVLQLDSEKNELAENNHRLTADRQDLRLKVEELKMRLASIAMMEQQNEMMKLPAAAVGSGLNVTEVNEQGLPQLHLGVPRNGSNNQKQTQLQMQHQQNQTQTEVQPAPLSDKQNDTATGEKPNDMKIQAQEGATIEASEAEINDQIKTKGKDEDEHEHSKIEDKPDLTLTVSPVRDQGIEDVEIANAEINESIKESNTKDKQVLSTDMKEMQGLKPDDGKQFETGMDFNGIQQQSDKDYNNELPPPVNGKVPNGGKDQALNVKDVDDYLPDLKAKEESNNLLFQPGGNQPDLPKTKPDDGNNLLPPPVQETASNPEKANEVNEVKWKPHEKEEEGARDVKLKEIL